MRKAIVFDVDGTLVSFQTHRVPQSAIEALRCAHRADVRIIIATGRSWIDLHELADVPYDAVIALNGSECVLRDGTPVSFRQIPVADFWKSLGFAQKYDFPIALETGEGVLVDRLNADVLELARLVAHPVPTVVDVEREFAQRPCAQLCFYCDEATERKIMPSLPGLSASRWHPIFADINVAGVNKATGLSEIAAHYGFDLSETIAFGDGGNDIPLLRAAGIGVAMGQASEQVKSAADYVTGSPDEDGIRNALLHFGILQTA